MKTNPGLHSFFSSVSFQTWKQFMPNIQQFHYQIYFQAFSFAFKEIAFLTMDTI